MKNGHFVISLDFELNWGVRDKKSIQEYGKNIKGVHQVIPKLLSLFQKFEINATFSTVGFLFFKSKKELLENIPLSIPHYFNKNYSPYNGHFDLVGNNDEEDLFHFAPLLIQKIKDCDNHEIGTHTFSHYYCLEGGQTLGDFEDDLRSAIKIAKINNIPTTSLIFPRNQFNDEYLDVCKKLGITCYRGNEHSWLYTAKSGKGESKIRRAIRLMDAYLNISGHNCYSEEYMKSKFPIDIPASRFLRPYSKRLKFFDNLKLDRIKKGMTYAAINKLTYHLWWHPHNFGINQFENFDFLEKILLHYRDLQKKYNYQSITMSKLASKCEES